MASFPPKLATFVTTFAGKRLQWQEWDEFYIVYQPSSAETHVFNETTALILKCLNEMPLLVDALKERTEASLGVGQGELVADDFAFATMRLEELGLIEYLDEPLDVQ